MNHRGLIFNSRLLLPSSISLSSPLFFLLSRTVAPHIPIPTLQGSWLNIPSLEISYGGSDQIWLHVAWANTVRILALWELDLLFHLIYSGPRITVEFHSYGGDVTRIWDFFSACFIFFVNYFGGENSTKMAATYHIASVKVFFLQPNMDFIYAYGACFDYKMERLLKRFCWNFGIGKSLWSIIYS